MIANKKIEKIMWITMALLSVIVMSILTFGGEYKIVCVPFAVIEIAIGMVMLIYYINIHIHAKNSDKKLK